MKKETLSTIASRTGYSITTISRVLSGNSAKYRISDKTAEAILSEARSCGYKPSSIAQNVRKNTTKTIGLLLPSISNPYFAEMAGVIIAELDKFGFMTIVIDTMESELRMLDYSKILIQRNVDGLIVAPCGDDPVALERIDMDIPVVLVDRYYPNTSLSYVTSNNYRASYLASELMISKGYKDIACIQGELSSTPNTERVKGYMDAMKDANLEHMIRVVGDEFSVQNGYLEANLLISDKRPQAIFALSNTIMLGSLKAIREVGLKIPEDIALLSFDDNLYMEYMTPVITRVSQPVEDMAKLAVKILLDKVNNSHKINYSQLRLSPVIVYGGSI